MNNERFSNEENQPIFENVFSLLSSVQEKRYDEIIEARLKVKQQDPNFSNGKKLIDFLEKSINQNGLPKPFIRIKSRAGEFNNLEEFDSEKYTFDEDEVLEINIDLVFLNAERSYEEHQENKQIKKENFEHLKEIGLKLELDPNLPTELKEITKWPKGIPDYNLLSAYSIYQLGDTKCYAKIGPDMHDPEHTSFELQMIWVDPEYRNKGLGTQMMKLLRMKYPNLSIYPVSEAGVATANKLYDNLNSIQ